jgi:hypothetical protein
MQAPESLLRNRARVLRPGGRLVVTTPIRLTEFPSDPNCRARVVSEEFGGLFARLVGREGPRVDCARGGGGSLLLAAAGVRTRAGLPSALQRSVGHFDVNALSWLRVRPHLFMMQVVVADKVSPTTKAPENDMTKWIPLAGLVGWIAFGDWLAGAALAVLALAWVMLPTEEGPPVLALAATMQWVSVSIGLFYNLLTGRTLEAIVRSDYRYMVLLGLGCVAATVVGLAAGRCLIGRMRTPQGLRPAHALTFKTLIVVYAVFTTALSAMRVTDIDLGGLAMAAVALTYLRLGLAYLIFRRLVAAASGITCRTARRRSGARISGFYAGFKDPLTASLAFLEFSTDETCAIGQPRRPGGRW